MAIDVICPGCKARFQVSDKFAGKKGPCPKCKAQIVVPAITEQVEIHAPEVTGPKGAPGAAASLKPLRRTETNVTVPMVVAVVGAMLVVLITAIVLRVQIKNPKEFPGVMLWLGAILLAPPLAWAGYSFLRDDELEPYRGRSLWLRVSACGAVYAALWAVYWGLKMSALLDGRAPQSFELLFYVPPFVLAGGFAAFVSLDLPYGSGLMHYGLYLLVTVLLRWIVGIGVM